MTQVETQSAVSPRLRVGTLVEVIEGEHDGTVAPITDCKPACFAPYPSVYQVRGVWYQEHELEVKNLSRWTIQDILKLIEERLTGAARNEYKAGKEWSKAKSEAERYVAYNAEQISLGQRLVLQNILNEIGQDVDSPTSALVEETDGYGQAEYEADDNSYGTAKWT